MKGRYTEQYDLVLARREMSLLVQALVWYRTEFTVDDDTDALIDEMIEVFGGEVPRPPQTEIPASGD